MTNFDDRLAARLRALDAAVPPPRPPDAAAGRAVLAGATKDRRRMLRRSAVLLAAATVLLVGASVVTGQRVFFPVRPEPALEAALVRIAAAHDCLTVETAEAEVRAAFASLGYKGWTVERGQGVDSSRCVAAAILSDTHSVLLIPGVGTEAAALLESLRAELMAQCLGRDDAVELVRTALAGIGRANDFDVRVDEGLKAIPADQAAEWEQHVAQGCYVLSGGSVGHSNGRTTLYLWGK